jgi:hypothetical protein
MQLFPIPQYQPAQHPGHMAPPAPLPMPPPSHEEDSAAQAAAARGYVYAYPPYGYPAQVCYKIICLLVDPWPLIPFIFIFIAHDARNATPWSSRRVYAWTIHAANALSSRHASSEWYALAFSNDHLTEFGNICSYVFTWDGSDAS